MPAPHLKVGVQVKGRAGRGQGHDVPRWAWAAAAATASSMVSTRRISGQPSRYWGAAITASWIFWAVLPRRDQAFLYLFTHRRAQGLEGDVLVIPPAIIRIFWGNRDSIPEMTRVGLVAMESL